MVLYFGHLLSADCNHLRGVSPCGARLGDMVSSTLSRVRRVRRRGLMRAEILAAVTIVAAFVPVGSASAAYNSATETTYVAAVPEAYEVSGLVASPRFANW